MASVLTPMDAALVRDLVRRHAAIVLDAGKEYLIESRLEQAIRDAGIPSVGELVSRARAGQAAAEKSIIEAMTTHETSFFRDHHPFEVLRNVVVPGLVAKRSGRSITIWSAACSTGQEPYSLAMMFREHFPEVRARIIATDLSEPILERARRGRFRQSEVNRGLPASLLVKHFVKEGTEWVLSPAVRHMVEFQKLNLLAPWTFGTSFDVVMMRNVLIYFDVPTKRQILGRLRSLVAPDGALFLGSAETTLGFDDQWDRLSHGNTSHYRPKP